MIPSSIKIVLLNLNPYKEFSKNNGASTFKNHHPKSSYVRKKGNTM
ncbi:hypothetical protein HanPSC8_Chr10g0421761 [Helianthus annuus]|nr:hypothetical protein HanPSC8_Chr10g0421761 [Helianthus annuus]